MSRGRRRHLTDGRKRSGSVLVYSITVMVVMLGFSSFAVDLGRVQLVKSELVAAADASARAAAAGLEDGTYLTRAQYAASVNSADGKAVSLLASDIETGTWDEDLKSFSPMAASAANAVRVTTLRSASRGDAVPLTVAQAIGGRSCDVRATSIAYKPDPADVYGIVGVRSFKSRGLFVTDSYPASGHGDVVSDGDITLNILSLVGVTRIDGDARCGVNRTIAAPLIKGLTVVTGTQAPLDKALTYPPVPDETALTNSNGLLSASQYNGQDFTALVNVHVPAGTYRVRNLTVLAGVTLTLDGAVTFYCTGNVTILGSVVVPSFNPANFRVRTIGTGTVNIVANVLLCLDLYAPESAVTLTAGVGYFGRLVGKDVEVLLTSIVVFDQRLGPPETADGSTRLVR